MSTYNNLREFFFQLFSADHSPVKPWKSKFVQVTYTILIPMNFQKRQSTRKSEMHWNKVEIF